MLHVVRCWHNLINMKITDVSMTIWINPSKGGKQIETCEEAEKLLKEIVELIKSKGYYMKPEMCSPNPHISIHKC